ncbi:MAG TPA: hypothetical protein DD791_09815 [Syntrophomonas sp.]|nr:hypothetical protein [Syntrophomonas sp.]
MFAFVFILISTPVTLAAGEPGIVTGTKNLLDAAMTWLLILIPVGCACVIAWHAFVKQMNEGDPAQAAIHNRAMKNALVAGAIGISASGIVKAVLAFYTGG